MGGKRPDQYAIDPGEAGATDYKSLRGEKIHDEDKQKVAQTRHDEREQSMIPARGKNPALADLQARRAAAQRDQPHAASHEQQGGQPAPDNIAPSTPRQADGAA